MVHRGYTDGFLLGQKADQNIDTSHVKSDWQFCGQVIENKRIRVKGVMVWQNFIKVHNTIKIGDVIEIVMPAYNVIKLRIKELYNAETGEKITEAHGGQGRKIIINNKIKFPKYSVLRRRVKI